MSAAAGTRVHALVVVHNRWPLTEKCLTRLVAEADDAGIRLRVSVVDDGSTDGTGELVAERFPGVHVIPGDGNLYWGRAMALAERSIDYSKTDYVLWINNDCDLEEGALGRLVEQAQATGAITCGAMVDPVTGRMTYSGQRRRVSRLGIMTLTQVAPSEAPVPVDAFNGNCVVIPAPAAERLRGVDPRFVHRYGDFDYGLRARALGVGVLLVPGHVGTTSRNSDRGTHLDGALPLPTRLRLLFSAKGHPLTARFLYLRRHGGWAWPVQLVGHYAVNGAKALLARPGPSS